MKGMVIVVTIIHVVALYAFRCLYSVDMYKKLPESQFPSVQVERKHTPCCNACAQTGSRSCHMTSTPPHGGPHFVTSQPRSIIAASPSQFYTRNIVVPRTPPTPCILQYIRQIHLNKALPMLKICIDQMLKILIDTENCNGFDILFSTKCVI